MSELQYKFTRDTVFKMLFVTHQGILKHFIAAVLGIAGEDITEFYITNDEIPPDSLGDKFCRLDINMVADGVRINLEVQVLNEGDYPERSLYHWAREYSSALSTGGSYAQLPRVVIISILDESIFDCTAYHSEYRPLEVTRHTPLSDRMEMHYFEIRKLPGEVEKGNELQLLLSLFRAKTEEDLQKLEAMEVAIVKQAIGAYREIVVSSKFKELERLRREALSNEASALEHARHKEAEKWRVVVADKDAHWQGVVADNDAHWQGVVADKDAQWQGVVADKDAQWQGVVANKDAEIVDKKAALADKDAEIERLKALIAGQGS
jgi:predicted transposase/invertase (TIGR01784 family)